MSPVLPKKNMTEEDIKLQYITPAITSKWDMGKITMETQITDGRINQKAKDQDTLALIKYIANEDKFEKLLEKQQVLITPIVRNGKQATVGYQPDIWKNWK